MVITGVGQALTMSGARSKVLETHIELLEQIDWQPGQEWWGSVSVDLTPHSLFPCAELRMICLLLAVID